MIDINKIYEKEKISNKKFKSKYDYSNPDIFYKQVLDYDNFMSMWFS